MKKWLALKQKKFGVLNGALSTRKTIGTLLEIKILATVCLVDLLRNRK